MILQEIRDESHRFAVRAQSRKKRKKIVKSELDDIKGVGLVLKNRLLKRFKNINNIRSADIKDLMTVEGINEKIALSITESLHND